MFLSIVPQLATPIGAAVAGPHPLAGTAAEWMWALPLLPLLGFILNGALSVFGAAHLGPGDPSAAGHGGHGSEAPPGGDRSPTGRPHDPEAGHLESHTAPPRHRFAPAVSIIGPLVLVAAFGLACAIFAAMVSTSPTTPFVQRYFSWLPVGDLQVDAAFQLDQLSMTLVLVITGVGALIHIFSVGYMRDDPGYPRYFAYLNLFVFFMLVLVLGANLPITFVGWEGVGLCSYLLIGFWFEDRANADAGKKAFIVNRVGDFGFLIAMFLLFANLGTLDYTGLVTGAPHLDVGGPVVTWACLFLLLGCAGKSAQIPLYVWLPDAMAGPTPVSALIHAATMVTAGVYLVARTSMLFALAPAADLTVCVIGGLTALFAATIGLKQWDIKKVLAYSTISQLGYMFVAVGAGAYVAGIFHLVTHAFFKALLFLGSGSVIYAMHAAYHETHSHEDAQDMRNMGGLRHKLPATWILMWIATLAIAGIPLFAGFFSKDEILGTVFERARGSTLSDASWLGVPGSVVLYVVYGISLLAAFLTAIYMTRLMIYTFHGPNRTGERESSFLHDAPAVMTGPLVVLGILSAIGGFLNDPAWLPIAPTDALTRWLDPVTGAATQRLAGVSAETNAQLSATLAGIAAVVAILGVVLAAVRLKPAALRPAREPQPAERGIERVVANKYYVDEVYDRAIVEPLVVGSRNILWRGVDGLIDGLVNLSAAVWRWIGSAGSALENGEVGTYAWALVAGVIVVLSAVAFRS
jgi:NADH-quinone oxidoreductase subunit L